MAKMTDTKIAQRFDGVMRRRSGQPKEVYRQDGFVNVLNKYGTKKDLMENYHYEVDPMVPDEVIEEFYEGDGLFARIIDMPSEEVVKNGFDLENVTDEKLVDYYQECLDELDWEENAIEAMKWTRLFGGALIVMLVDDGRGIDEPVDWNNVKGVKEMVVYDRTQVTVDWESMYQYEHYDPFRNRRKLGEPEYFYVYSRYGNFVVHESRCLIFKNGKLPEKSTNSIYQYWGMPEYPKVYRAIRNVELAQNSAPKMLDRSVQPIYKMRNLMEELASEGGEERVLHRLDTIDTSRGIMNTITIDAEGEEYDFRQFGFSGVADAISSSANYLSAVTNIPQVLLFGSPISGMSSTDDTAMEAYYNYIQRYQKKTVVGNLRRLLELIFRGGVNSDEIDEIPDIRVQFKPLWSLNEVQQVDLDLKKAQLEQIRAATALQYMQAQVIDPSEIRRTLAKSDDFDIETMMDDYTEEELEEFMPKQQEQQDPMAAMMGAMGGGAPGGMPGMGAEEPQAEEPEGGAEEEKEQGSEPAGGKGEGVQLPKLPEKPKMEKQETQKRVPEAKNEPESAEKESDDKIAAEKVERALKGDSDSLHTDRHRFDDDEGKWITVKGQRIHLNANGEPDRGNPKLISAMKGSRNEDPKPEPKKVVRNFKSDILGDAIKTRKIANAIKKVHDLAEKSREAEELVKKTREARYPKPKNEWTEDDRIKAEIFGDKPMAGEEEYLEAIRRSDELDAERAKASKALTKAFATITAPKKNDDFENPVKASKEDYEGFQLDTGVPDYQIDRLKEEGYECYISEMTPIEYMDRVAANFNTANGKGDNLAKEIFGTSESNVAELQKKMESGTKLYMPYLNVADLGAQEGRHRAMAAFNLGYEKIPVLFVYKPNKDSRFDDPEDEEWTTVEHGDVFLKPTDKTATDSAIEAFHKRRAKRLTNKKKSDSIRIDWSEEQHPRGKGGKFVESGNASKDISDNSDDSKAGKKKTDKFAISTGKTAQKFIGKKTGDGRIVESVRQHFVDELKARSIHVDSALKALASKGKPGKYPNTVEHSYNGTVVIVDTKRNQITTGIYKGKEEKAKFKEKAKQRKHHK